MTAFMCSLFYIYVVYAISYYRREIIYRLNHGYSEKVKKKYKAPLSLMKSVLLCSSAIIINIILQLIYGSETLVLINAVPVIVCMLRLRKYEKTIIKFDKE